MSKKKTNFKYCIPSLFIFTYRIKYGICGHGSTATGYQGTSSTSCGNGPTIDVSNSNCRSGGVADYYPQTCNMGGNPIQETENCINGPINDSTGYMPLVCDAVGAGYGYTDGCGAGGVVT